MIKSKFGSHGSKAVAYVKKYGTVFTIFTALIHENTLINTSRGLTYAEVFETRSD